MKTQIWNRTTIVWDFDHILGPKTNIPVDDWNTKEKLFHTLVGLRAISLPDRDPERRGVIEVTVYRVSIGPTTKRQEIISRLETLDDSIVTVDDGRFANPIKITYRLKNGESFCDSAIKKAELILKKFGIKDKDKYFLCNFIPIQETLVRTKDAGWIPYGDYLRHKHKLPQLCSLYKNSIRLEGGLVIRMDYQESPSNFLHTRG